jgi:hypothetical protein
VRRASSIGPTNARSFFLMPSEYVHPAFIDIPIALTWTVAYHGITAT